MAAAIGVRTDYTSADLRGFARRCDDEDQVRRLLAVALILDGGSRSEAATVAGVTLQIVRDWVLRFNAGGPGGLATRKAPGRVRSSGADHPGAPEGNANRAVVAGRSTHRPADQAHQALGETWHPSLGAKGSAPVLGMDLRGDLPRRRQGRRHRHAQV